MSDRDALERERDGYLVRGLHHRAAEVEAVLAQLPVEDDTVNAAAEVDVETSDDPDAHGDQPSAPRRRRRRNVEQAVDTDPAVETALGF